MRPGADESTRSAIGSVIAERVDWGTTADALRTDASVARWRSRSARYSTQQS
ncbi:hypothetical protein [Prescottella agglutinans]|uniref:hypothetical protein n=1 Tax=Prescottella agglutinans TaxID=1644129 RepID=UPI0013E3FE3E|nr:hypothetical protein [Prescottella agglutinans]